MDLKPERLKWGAHCITVALTMALSYFETFILPDMPLGALGLHTCKSELGVSTWHVLV